MTERQHSRSSMTREIVLSLPFAGLWLARNSPARRVPSHGTDLFGERYAIDFIGVDHRRRSADRRDWRTFLGTEPAERFFAYGRPILAPADGVVVEVHDGEIDHVGRRSQLTLLPYALGQPARVRQGVGAIAGNYLIIALRDSGAFVALVHLRAGSIRVAVGEEVTTGQPVADCGNSGNSTQPHLHMQIMDSPDLSIARGVPMAFRRFREWPRDAKDFQIRESGLPGEGAVVEPLPVLAADVGPLTNPGNDTAPPVHRRHHCPNDETRWRCAQGCSALDLTPPVPRLDGHHSHVGPTVRRMEKGQFAKPTDADKAWFESLLPDHPDVSRKPMFGNLAGFAAGNMFLALFGSTVAVRLDDASRQELLAEDGAESFEPMPGRAMKEYVTLPDHWRTDDLDEAQRWVDRSLAYALTLPPKKPK